MGSDRSRIGSSDDDVAMTLVCSREGVEWERERGKRSRSRRRGGERGASLGSGDVATTETRSDAMSLGPKGNDEAGIASGILALGWSTTVVEKNEGSGRRTDGRSD